MQQLAADLPTIESESGIGYERSVRILVAGLVVSVVALATVLWLGARSSAPIMSAPTFVPGHPTSVTIAAYVSALPFSNVALTTPSRVVRVHDLHWVTKLMTDLNSLPALSRVPRCPPSNDSQDILTFGYADGNRWRLRVYDCDVTGGEMSWPGITPVPLEMDLSHLLGQSQPV